MPGRRLFISYSHADEELFKRLRVHLDPLVTQGLLELETDQQLKAGDDWDRELHLAIERSELAVVVLSPDLLASDYVKKTELPALAEAHAEDRLRLLPLFLRPCQDELSDWSCPGFVDTRTLARMEVNDAENPSPVRAGIPARGGQIGPLRS